MSLGHLVRSCIVFHCPFCFFFHLCRAVYGYANNTNDLKLVSKGNGGLDELAGQLDESKILYAFTRVVDPNTELTKFVLINWVSLLLFVILIVLFLFVLTSQWFLGKIVSKGAHVSFNYSTSECLMIHLIIHTFGLLFLLLGTFHSNLWCVQVCRVFYSQSTFNRWVTGRERIFFCFFFIPTKDTKGFLIYSQVH